MRNKKFPRSNSRPRMYQNENNVPPPERYPGVLTTKDIEYIVQNCMNLYGDLVINLKAIRRSIMETPQKEEDVLCIDKSFMEILLNHDYRGQLLRISSFFRRLALKYTFYYFSFPLQLS